MRRLVSIKTLLIALGPENDEQIARRYGVSRQAVQSWRLRGKIPASYYFRMQNDLAKLGFEAPARLWGIDGSKREPTTCRR